MNYLNSWEYIGFNSGSGSHVIYLIKLGNDVAVNGIYKFINSQNITPKLQISAGKEYPVSSNISGAIYRGVPRMPFKFYLELFKFFANPKSPNLILFW